MNRRALILSTTVIAVVLMSPGLFARTWTDNTGNRHFEGEFVGLADGQVEIRRDGGKVVHVPMEKLSKEDQTFVRKAAKPATESKTATPASGERRQTSGDQGKAFLEAKDFDTAFACFTQAIMQDPSNSEAYRLRAAVRKAKLGGDTSAIVPVVVCRRWLHY